MKLSFAVLYATQRRTLHAVIKRKFFYTKPTDSMETGGGHVGVRTLSNPVTSKLVKVECTVSGKSLAVVHQVV